VTKDEKQRLVDAASPIQISVCVENPREKLLRDVSPDPTPMMNHRLTPEMLREFFEEEQERAEKKRSEPLLLPPHTHRKLKKWAIEAKMNEEADLIHKVGSKVSGYEVHVSIDVQDIIGPIDPRLTSFIQTNYGDIPIFVCPTLPENTFVFVWGGKR
jgi:hypothetical protein